MSKIAKLNSLTLNYNFFILDKYENFNEKNILKTVELLKYLETTNTVLSSNAVLRLAYATDEAFSVISNSLKSKFKEVQGEFFRGSFGTNADVSNEQITFEEIITQIQAYFLRYGLGILPHEFVAYKNKTDDRDFDEKNVTVKDGVQELNNTFKIIDAKSTTEFADFVSNIICAPIVFGVQQSELISCTYDNGLLGLAFGKDTNIKVKENLFKILECTNKEFFREYKLLKTTTDVLRYAYFVTGLDYALLEKGVKFDLRTSDKTVIMSNLNSIGKNYINAVSDIKPYKSQFLALSKNLFPGSKKYNKYPEAQKLFDYVRNNVKVQTFNTKKEELISNNDMRGLIELLSEKPGELLRRLDMIIRKGSDDDIEYLCTKMLQIKLNPKLIIQVRKWIRYREDRDLDNRVIMVKGKGVIIDKKIQGLDSYKVKIVQKTLKKVFAKHLENKKLF